MKKRILLLFSFILFVSCSKEISRIAFNENLDSEICYFELTEKQKIEVWTDLNIEYTEPFSLVYEIELLKDDEVLYEKICDSFDVDYKKKSLETQLNKKHSVKYQGRLKAKFGKLEKGNYKLLVKPIIKGKEFKLKKIDIFVAK